DPFPGRAHQKRAGHRRDRACPARREVPLKEKDTQPDKLLFGKLFFGLRQAGVKVGVGEWMSLMQALSEGAIGPSLRDFYAAGRALLVKHESLFDTWDQVFEAVFGEGELPAPALDRFLEWLADP